MIPHLTYDTYLGETAFVPADLGLTVGFIPPNAYVEGEIGVDAFYPIYLVDENGSRSSKIPFQFNGKLMLKEGALAPWSPGLSAGIANAGLVTNQLAPARNDFNLLYAVLGKTFSFGTVGIGAYTGNEELFVDGKGEKDDVGFMASFATSKIAMGVTGLKDLSFAADLSSGSNWFSAFGAAAEMVVMLL